MAPNKNILSVSHVFKVTLTFLFEMHLTLRPAWLHILILISFSKEPTMGGLLMGQWIYLAKEVIWK